MATVDESDGLTKYRETVVTVFNSQYYVLRSAVEDSMQEFAGKAYAAHMISKSVMRSKDFYSITTDFLDGLNFKNSVQDIQQYCQRFIDILEDLGGPALEAARLLSIRWSATNSGIYRNCGCS